MENKIFKLHDFLEMHELILTLRESTVPKNEHVDSIGVDLMWHKLDCLLIDLGNQFKEQLIDKESIEKIMGKKINSFKKEYNEKGEFTGVIVEPVQTVEFITCQFTITPEGASFDKSKPEE